MTKRMRTCMEQKLREERTWNATQLAEVLAQSFGVEVTPEKPSASISSRWAARGSALHMCPIKHQIPNRSGVKPGKIWRGLQGGGPWRDRPEVPR